MKTLRIAFLAAAAAFALTAAATAQTATQSAPQVEQSGGGCGWKANSAATS
jgi:hypothetical protein